MVVGIFFLLYFEIKPCLLDSSGIFFPKCPTHLRDTDVHNSGTPSHRTTAGYPFREYLSCCLFLCLFLFTNPISVLFIGVSSVYFLI